MQSPSPILILDGGLGTTLEDEYGVKFSHQTPLWSSHLLVTDPDTLSACQDAFGRIPVDVLLTATYQASIEGFAGTRSAAHPNGFAPSEIPSFLDLAISIAERAKAPSAKLALSLGSYGAMMIPSQEYTGLYDAGHSSVEQLLQWHQERLEMFAPVRNLPDRIGLLAFETVPKLDEIVAIRKLTAACSPPFSTAPGHSLLPDIPYWVSCVFPGDGFNLPDGSSVDQMVESLFSSDYSDNLPWGIGINCTKISKISRLVDMYEKALSQLHSTGNLSEWPSLVLYPDGTNGEVYDTVTKTWQKPDNGSGSAASPWEQQLAEIVFKARSRACWRSIVVGGCCKAAPSDIAKLRRALLDSPGNQSS
ncbi:Homocysteine S-methyltransferase [Xylariomycetidae sp. FL0641]|nr:Homocysteine S-methyltransferase [Xylariomycetidae sp. FL0641]